MVELLTDNRERFEPGSELELGGPAGVDGCVTVRARRAHKAGLVVEFDGYTSRDAVEALRGADLEVPRHSVPPAEDGVYYHFELIGCSCVDTELGELGVVEELREDGGGELLVLRGGGRRLLVPFVAAFVRAIDIEARRIELELPPGLFEACASES